MTLDDLPRDGLTLAYYQDSGHGWIQAPIEFVALFELEPTRYSYTDGFNIFLEEDCDGPELLRALRDLGIDYSLREIHYPGDCFIRSLMHYRPTEPRNRGQMPLDLD